MQMMSSKKRLFLLLPVMTFILACQSYFGSAQDATPEANPPVTTAAAPCGVVDAMIYPIENLMDTTIRPGFDDFSLYRARFGGNHVGIDIAFNQQGAPVRAVARGRVTLSNVEEWDTEKGVVILEHIFPDGSRFYSLYGHMEETNTIRFPQVGACMEMGDTVGGVGWPSRGAPHLHYEIRDFLPDEGGPGYTSGNPLTEGWYQPIDFTHLWQIRLTPAFENYTSFEVVPTVPPVMLDSGTMVIASGDVIEGVAPSNGALLGQVLWRVTTDGRVIGLKALPGDRVVAHTINGQAMTLTGGRYTALWQFAGAEEAFVNMGETLLFVGADGSLAAYSPAGESLWTLTTPIRAESEIRIADFKANGDEAALGIRTEGGIRWRVVDSSGQVIVEDNLTLNAVTAPMMGGGWVLLSGGQLKRFTSGGQEVASNPVNIAPGRTAQLAADLIGNTYLFIGDADNALVSWDAGGTLRWQVRYPAVSAGLLPPLLQTDSGCVLYVLDVDGRLNLFNAANGDLFNQVELYPGGVQNRRPSARLLEVEPTGMIRVNAGFLTTMTLRGSVLGASALSSCVLG